LEWVGDFRSEAEHPFYRFHRLTRFRHAVYPGWFPQVIPESPYFKGVASPMSRFTDALVVSPLADGKTWVILRDFGYDYSPSS
jgi:hypothetical protein